MPEKVEKRSLFQTAIERLSFRSRRKKDNKYDIVIEPMKEVCQSINVKDVLIDTIAQNIDAVVKRAHTDITSDEQMPERSKVPPAKPPHHSQVKKSPSSATPGQSRSISQLDSALRKFKQEAAQSRANLNVSRLDISQAFSPGLVSLVSKHCPPTPPARWRQRPPPTSSCVEEEWKKLSTSMINLDQSRRNLAGQKANITETDVSLRSSNMSLDTGCLKMGTSKVVVEEVRVARTQSMTVLDMARGDRNVQIPCNQLMEMNPYQRRVQASMERLSVPSWYKPPDTPSPSSTTPLTTRWRQASSSSSSSSSSAGWRRHISHSASPSTTSTLDRNSTPLSSQRYRSRFGTLPSSTRSPSNSSINSSSSTISSTPSKQVYLGWRSQERLDIGPAYLASPAQRLASSASHCSVRPGSRSATDTATFKEGIKEVTEAILHFCNSPSGDKPPQVKEAWHHVEDESDENNDTLDDDSGIDRSDDFTQKILNEE